MNVATPNQPAPEKPAPGVRHAWEAAYQAFETPEQEIAKFLRRLCALGADRWDRQLRVAEIFCGRGNGLVAWQRLGFTRLTGLDLSPELVAAYAGSAIVQVGDARRLPWPDQSFDVVAVQGGLHHLPSLIDLASVLDEVRRVLVPAGRFVVVEPWLTPFLRLVHHICNRPLARRFSRKIDALATMIDLETPLYPRWLSAPDAILAAFESRFTLELRRAAWGKLTLLARPRPIESPSTKS